MMDAVEAYLQKLPEFLALLAQEGEYLFAKVYAEETQYARLTQARVNQSGGIHQTSITLYLANERAMVSASLEGQLPENKHLDEMVRSLRSDLPWVPDDPWISLNMTRQQQSTGKPWKPVDFDVLVNTLCASAEDHDLVGSVLSGPQIFAVCSSLGHHLVHRGGGTMMDLSFFDAQYNAVKKRCQDPTIEDIPEFFAGMIRDLRVLQRAPMALNAGSYRAWLSPEALDELLGTLSWNGFSTDAVRSGSSPLSQLYGGAKNLSQQVNLSETRAISGVPAFSDQGFVLPPEISLVQAGHAVESLSSPRTAKEFDTCINSDFGFPMALHMETGDLPGNHIFEKIGTGLYIGRLWYTNISDPTTCRLTAMTRYDCFWVENGELLGPLAPMRIDSSLFQLLGDDLDAVGSEAKLIPESHSYGQRAWGASRLPGVLTALTITL